MQIICKKKTDKKVVHNFFYGWRVNEQIPDAFIRVPLLSVEYKMRMSFISLKVLYTTLYSHYSWIEQYITAQTNLVSQSIEANNCCCWVSTARPR